MRIQRLRGDRGDITLPGLLTAAAISIIVLGAVLQTFAGAQTHSTELTAANANQQTVRAGSDALAAALRNLASPTPEQPQAIDRADPFDLIFQNVDPAGPNAGLNATNVRRERWCLDTAGTLHTQRQTWTTATVPTAPPTSACPGPGWNTTAVINARLTNRVGSPERSLFTYDAAALTDIASVHVDMYLDEDPLRKPDEVRIATGIFLRNQNRKPTASFTATATPQGIVLNASASADPEGQPLAYTWLRDGVDVAEGVTATYAAGTGTHVMSVRVHDPAGLTATSSTQTVVIG